MKKHPLLITLLILLTACGFKSDDEFHVIDESEMSQTENKPELNIDVEIINNQAILIVDTNLRISEENYGGQMKQGEGHIHVYVNNGKKQAITAFRYILKDVKPGHNVVRVSLHNNDHTPYGVYQVEEFIIE
jgi:hypothetical protein